MARGMVSRQRRGLQLFAVLLKSRGFSGTTYDGRRATSSSQVSRRLPAAMVYQDHWTIVYRQVIEVQDWAAPYVPLIKPLFRIETHMKLEERLELIRLAVRLPEGFVACELGSHLGASAAL